MFPISATTFAHRPVGKTIFRSIEGVSAAIENVGRQVTFLFQMIGAIPYALRHYRREMMNVLTDITFGSGRIVVGGGTVSVLALLGVAVGGSIGIEGFTVLDMVGMGPLTGFISAYANTREMAPMIAAIGFAIQAGCRFTAEIGAMRIGEEIDALESMAVKPIPFVVTTRVLAALITTLPLYLITLILSYLSCALVVNVIHGQSTGTYYHYFGSFIQTSDVVYSIIKASVFVVLVTFAHTYQGFYASGGPEGVGRASGQAIRASLVLIVIADMILTLMFWGLDVGIRISG